MKIPFNLRLLLWAHNRQGAFDAQKSTPESFRGFNETEGKRLAFLVDYKPEKMHQITNKTIQTPTHEIPIRIYQPVEGDSLPILMYFHGGGFTIGSLETHDSLCRRLAKLIKCVVISVDYRLGPEHKFPAAPEDAFQATLWAYENAKSIKGDAHRIALMGDSAGGNLATVVSMMARDRGVPFKILHQVLIYPCVDATLSGESIETNAKGYILTKDMMQWFLNHYTQAATDLKAAYLSPLWAENLQNLPPALIITAEYDPLCSEGTQYARKLREAGNQVIHTNYEGMVHIFFQMPKFLKKCRIAHEQVASILRMVFGTDGIL
jgi:acetyl esterase